VDVNKQKTKKQRKKTKQKKEKKKSQNLRLGGRAQTTPLPLSSERLLAKKVFHHANFFISIQKNVLISVTTIVTMIT